MADEETVSVQALSATTTQAKARQHTFVVDKLPSSGGGDRAPMSSEYLLGALASCQITSAYKVAAKRGRRIDALTVTSTGTIDGGIFTKIHLTIRIQGDGQASDWETVFRLVERVCTISRALSVPVTRTVEFA